jgi:hypothetical protein
MLPEIWRWPDVRLWPIGAAKSRAFEQHRSEKRLVDRAGEPTSLEMWIFELIIRPLDHRRRHPMGLHQVHDVA